MGKRGRRGGGGRGVGGEDGRREEELGGEKCFIDKGHT